MTIAAIATAQGRSGVAVVRVSGPDAWAIARALTGKTGGARAPSITHEILYSPTAAHTEIDDAVVLRFRAPNSYTGEDVVEFQCHGGYVTPRRVLEACFAAGARLAERGEFTRRAFLNGKLGYEQAEAVLNLIDAKTERAADDALAGLSGGRHRIYRELYDLSLAASADIEHALDIDESELPIKFYTELDSKIAKLVQRLDDAIRKLREGRILRNGATVVLSGPPNVGKSSLMNSLLGENRAIVSDIPGTTRDSIEEWLDIDGWPVRLVDTAGLRLTDDVIEAEGVARAEKLAAAADIVLELSENPLVEASSPKAIAVVTKCDRTEAEPCKSVAPRAVRTSAKTGEGLDDLRSAIVKRLAELADNASVDSLHDASPDASKVCEDALLAARQIVCQLHLSPDSDLVLVANSLRTAAQRLATLSGAIYSGDLLENLFSRFCVGK